MTRSGLPAAGRAPTILFVDDEPSILRSLRRELYDTGLDMHVRTSAADALPVIEAGHVSVVVTDLCMPGMDGIEFLEKVQAIDPTVVRILLTGHADLVSPMEVVNRGQLFRLLIKPWDHEELLLTLRSAVEHHALLAEHASIIEEKRTQQELLCDLENRYPGITSVNLQDAEGAYIIRARS